MKTVRVTGKTVEDAVAAGLKELGITRAEAVVHVVEEPSGGLFGLLRKKPAVVDVSAPEQAAEEAPETAPAPVEAAPQPAPETAPAAEADAPAEAPAPKADAAEPAAEAPAEEKEAPKAEEAAKPEESKAGDKQDDFVFSEKEQQETADAAKKFLEGVFKSMDMDVTMEKMMSRERILLNLHGKGLGILIGKHGQTLNSLQYLTNLAAGKLYRHHYFVLLDVENYRVRREETLKALALRLAAKVKRTGESVALEPMEPGERRIIHLALQNDTAITTDSEGEGSYRHVVIKAN